MKPKHVMVFLTGGRGKPGLSTVHLAVDELTVHEALSAAGIGKEPAKERTEWKTKLVDAYLKELRKRGLQVTIVNNKKTAHVVELGDAAASKSADR